jgi:hypothetical protein
MRRWRNGAAVVLATLALATVSCAGGGQSVVGSGTGTTGPPDGTAHVRGASTTPGSVAPTELGLRHDLMKVAEVRPFQAFGYDIRQVPLVDPGKWDVTVLRGPCGATLSTPFTPGDDTRIFFSTVALLVETTAAWDDRAAAFFEAAQRDMKVGCAGFDDPSAFGARVVLTAMVDLDPYGRERVGWTQTIAGTERTGLRQVALVHDDDRLLMLAVVTSPPAPPDVFTQLANAVFTAP